MKFKRVLLIHPKTTGEWVGIRPPTSLGYIAQALYDNEIEYNIIDMQLGHRESGLLRRIDSYRPDLIGLGLVSLGYKQSYNLIEKIKEKYLDAKIIVGGPHVSILKSDVLNECEAIDYGVVYEGEKTLVELCKGINREENIKGLMFRREGKIFYSGDREWALDLDSLSFPRYKNFEMNRYVKEISIISSRGCSNKCVFCPNALISSCYRARSPENVAEEIEYWYDQGYREFNFDDDNFNFDKGRVYLICDEIEKRGLKGVYLRCANGLRADRLDRDLLTRMKKVGFRYIGIGVDGGNDRVLKMIKKGETIEHIEKGVKDACDLGFDVKIQIIIGHPGETVSDIEDSFKFAQKFPISRVHFYNLIPYPGTEVFEQISARGFFLMNPERYLNDISDLSLTPIFETSELPAPVRIELLKKAKKIQKKITVNAIKRMYRENPILGKLAGYFFASDFMQKMIYKNVQFRKMIEYLRQKKSRDS